MSCSLDPAHSAPVPPLLVLVRPTPGQQRARPPRERVAAQSLAARDALREAAARVGCHAREFHQVEPGGRPLPVDGWHWSISHDDTWVAAVLHTAPVGVDLERVAGRRAALHERVAGAEERALLEPWDALAFTRLWTAKEAVLKAAGVGIAELSSCRLRAVDGEDLLLDHRGEARRVRQRRFREHVLAVHAGDEPLEVRWDLPGQ